MMIAEVMAALGDELSYVQDRDALEAYLETATQRRSLRHHARRVDYDLFDGRAARTWLDLTRAAVRAQEVAGEALEGGAVGGRDEGGGVGGEAVEEGAQGATRAGGSTLGLGQGQGASGRRRPGRGRGVGLVVASEVGVAAGEDARCGGRREARRVPVRLANLKVAMPCRERWDHMVGDDRVSMCDRCDKPVFNLSEMTHKEAETVLAARGVPPCMRFFRRADGTVKTADCPSRKRAVVFGGAAGAFAAAGVAFALRPQRPAPRRDAAAAGRSRSGAARLRARRARVPDDGRDGHRSGARAGADAGAAHPAAVSAGPRPSSIGGAHSARPRPRARGPPAGSKRSPRSARCV